MTNPRIPGEFRYWENLPTPRVQRMRRVLRLLFRADPVLPDETVRQYAAAYYRADPVAEALVDEVHLKQGQKAGRALLDRALEHGVGSIPDAPASLRTLFAEIEQPPTWLDWQQVELGARVFRRWGKRLFSFAGAITLEGYRENSVAKPLVLTGAYVGESAQRRFLETAAFWIDVSEPGSLRPGGIGVRTALRVRLMHVFVRRKLLQHPQWDLDAWGVPISQGDAMLTLMGGSYAPGIGLKLLGYRTSNEEILATMHYWRYIGHLMGVQPAWYPTTLQEALGLLFTSQVKSVHKAGEDGRSLARSYVDSYAPAASDTGLAAIKKRIERGVELGYTSLFLHPHTYRTQGLPRPGLWRFAPLMQSPAIFALETARRRSGAVERWMHARAGEEAKRWLRTHLGERAAEYRAVENFTR